MFGPVLGNILNLFIAISCMGTMNGLMLGCCRGMYSLAARNEGPKPELFRQIDKVSNMPTNSAIIGLLFCAIWGTYFYLSNLAGTWSGAVAFEGTALESVPFLFDSSELPIITIYAMYIPIFIQWMHKATDETAMRRFVIPALAIIGNEIGVGAGIRMSGVPREKLFVTSKLWNDVRGYEETLKAFDASLKRLALDYLDLYLIHWPRPLAFRDTYQEVNRETWKAFEYLLEKGYVRAIGVSNFLPVHMEALLKTAQVIPMVDQIEFHPGWMQPETAAFCKEHDILVEAWSPLGSGKLLEDPKLKEFGQKYGRSTAQICLRWCLQKGHLPLPKSVTPVRIKENLQLFDFQISQEDMAVIDKLECVGRTGSDPDNAKF